MQIKYAQNAKKCLVHSMFSRISVLAAIGAGPLETFYGSLNTLALGHLFDPYPQNSVWEKLNPSSIPEIKVVVGEGRGKRSKVIMFCPREQRG